MSWKEKMNAAVKAVKDAAESDTVQRFATTAKQTAVSLATKAKEGALTAADAFVAANSDPSALKIRFLNVEISIVSPSDNLTIERPNAATLTITDKDGNGVVIDASAAKPYVTETVGQVNQLDNNTYDLGAADGIDLLIIKG
jgi:hypothetical protein